METFTEQEMKGVRCLKNIRDDVKERAGSICDELWRKANVITESNEIIKSKWFEVINTLKDEKID